MLRKFFNFKHYDFNRKKNLSQGYDGQFVMKIYGKCVRIHAYPAICHTKLFPSKERSKEHFLYGVPRILTALQGEQRGMRFPCCPSKAPEQCLYKIPCFQRYPLWAIDTSMAFTPCKHLRCTSVW